MGLLHNRKNSLSVALVLLFIFSLSDVNASNLNSSSVDKEMAASFLNDKDYEKAFSLYSNLLPEMPTDVETNLGLAISAVGTGKYTYAVLAYERLIEIDQKNALYHLQLGYVYASIGNMNNARYHIDLAKKYNPDIEVEIKQINSYQDTRITTPYIHKPWILGGNISVGMIFDTNANGGPSSDVLNVGLLNNIRFDGVRGKSSVGNYASIDFEAKYKELAQDKLSFIGGINAYERWNFAPNLHSNNKSFWGKLSAGGVYEFGKTYTDLRLKVENMYINHKDFDNELITSYGPELSFAFRLDNKIELLTKAGYEYQVYSESKYENGHYWYLGEYLYKDLVSGLGVYLGGGLLGADVKEKSYSYLGWDGIVRLIFNAKNNISLSSFVMYRQEYFDGPATALDIKDRQDKQARIGSSITWTFKPNWSYDFAYQYIDNHSNSEIYRYDEHLITTGINWKF